jgi:hypothetical protein
MFALGPAPSEPKRRFTGLHGAGELDLAGHDGTDIRDLVLAEYLTDLAFGPDGVTVLHGWLDPDL